MRSQSSDVRGEQHRSAKFELQRIGVTWFSFLQCAFGNCVYFLHCAFGNCVSFLYCAFVALLFLFSTVRFKCISPPYRANHQSTGRRVSVARNRWKNMRVLHTNCTQWLETVITKGNYQTGRDYLKCECTFWTKIYAYLYVCTYVSLKPYYTIKMRHTTRTRTNST